MNRDTAVAWGKTAAKIIIVLWSATSILVTFIWATTDKTKFWEQFDIASTDRVQSVESSIAEVQETSAQTLAEVRAINNGRILDRWLQIRESDRFSPEEKERIKDGVFVRKTITADSLSSLLLDK